jgi:hypothetical protein
VFPAQIPALLAARTWQVACEIRSRVGGKRMSKQA